MRRFACLITVALVALAGLTGPGCVGRRAKSDVTAAELKSAVARDIVPFAGDAVPQAAIDTLAGFRVVLIGEYHQTSGSTDVAGQLAVGLRGKGLRQVVLECPQAYSWMLDAYVQGTIGAVRGTTPTMYLPLLNRIRAGNDGLPAADRIHVAAFDMNHSVMDLRLSLETLATQLRDPGAITEFLSSVGNGTDNVRAATALRARIDAAPSLMAAQSGMDYGAAVRRMIDIEERSDALRGSDVASGRGAAAREKLLKEVVVSQLGESTGNSLVYTGFYHTQKTTYYGSEKEFFGRYLHYSSSFAGKCFSLVIVPTSGEIQLGSRTVTVDAGKNPENELFRVASDVSGQQKAFLPLHDPLFSERKVLASYYVGTVVAPPVSQYDGFLLVPDVEIVSRQTK